MELSLHIALSAAYMRGLFLFLIQKWEFFRIGQIPVRWFQVVFILKVLSGIALGLIYTYYYRDRSTADIWKYFDDGMVMYSALRERPLDYFKMLFGVMNDTPHFDRYYDAMRHWYRPYGSSMSNDTHTIIRFNAAIRPLSFGFYNVHSVWVNFLGLIGLTGILHFLRQLDISKERWFFLAVFMMPSVMFWGSGVLKEPLLFFGLGIFLYGVMRLSDGVFTLRHVLLVALSLVFLITVKSYALVAVLPGLVAWRLGLWSKALRPAVWTVLVYGVTVVAAIGLGHAFPEQDILHRLAQKQSDFNRLATGGTYVKRMEAPHDTLYIPAAYFAQLSFSKDRRQLQADTTVSARPWRLAFADAAGPIKVDSHENFIVLLDYGKTGSSIAIPILDGGLVSTVKAAPIALVNAMLRPFPKDVDSPFMLMAGLENMLLLGLLVLMIFRFPDLRSVHPLVFVAISFGLVILVLTGLVTPVIGAIVRYKVPALPFLACAIIALIRQMPLFMSRFERA
jgi:hypothetical protein